MNPSEKIKIVIAHFECRMYPTVIAGTTDDGSTIYVRYRWGQLTIRLDPRDPAPHGGAAGVWIMVKQLDPEGLAGCLSYDEIRELTAQTLVWPENPTPTPRNEGEPWLDL